MPRPKGSKNKVTRARAPRKASITTHSTDLAALIADKSSARDLIAADIASLEENLTSIKADLKAKKAELKKLDTELEKLVAQKAEMVAREAEEAKKSELDEMIKKLMADGMSAAEILEKLK